MLITILGIIAGVFTTIAVLPQVFKVIKTGKRKKKAWKRMITKVTFVGEGFTRKPPKYERFIRPTGLRFKKAHVCHPEAILLRV